MVFSISRRYLGGALAALPAIPSLLVGRRAVSSPRLDRFRAQPRRPAFPLPPTAILDR